MSLVIKRYKDIVLLLKWIFLLNNEKIIIKSLFNKVKLIGVLGSLEKNISLSSKILYLNYSFVDNIFIISKCFLKTFLNFILKMFIGVVFGWFFFFNIFGRGFSFRLKKRFNSLFLRLKVGYSHIVYYKIPNNIFVKINKKRNRLFIFSLDFWLVSKVAFQLRNLRSKHVYKKQGITFFKEKIIIKPGKKKQT